MGHLATEDGQLVTKHDDFHGQLLLGSPEEPDQLEHSDEGELEEGQRHNKASLSRARSTRVLLRSPG